MNIISRKCHSILAIGAIPILSVFLIGFGLTKVAVGKFSISLRQQLTDIQLGRASDSHGWMVRTV
jgi:hypothetical protein